MDNGFGDGANNNIGWGIVYKCEGTDCPDATLTLNSAAFTTVGSDTTTDIILQDQNNDPITPDDVTGTTITVTVGSTPVGATLMKTGQTVSYASTDDGDIEAGRATDFLTLSANNPFSNTNRFTDVAGGQTYTLAIVIDWSTYDGSTVTGYRKTKSSGYTDWSTALTNAAGTSIGTYTTGWRLPNRKELENIMNYGVATSVLNYSPFSITADTNLWTGTTNNLNTANAFMIASTGSGGLSGVGKAIAAGEYIPCRTFTVTGTTLS